MKGNRLLLIVMRQIIWLVVGEGFMIRSWGNKLGKFFREANVCLGIAQFQRFIKMS